jgi:hypothetical protein
MSSFNIKSLRKTDPSLTRNPDTLKYYISCGDKITQKTPTTEGWLRIMDTLRIPREFNKSHILLGNLEKYGEIVVKVGDSDNIIKEYSYSNLLKNTKGFVKYICAFKCNDDFTRLTGKEESICKGPGSSMKVVLMPYFPMGSIAAYNWNVDNIHVLRSSLKHAFLSIMIAFSKGFIHGDLHSGNVLLKKTSQSSITYSIPGMEPITIPTNGVRTWIMDFENSSIAKTDTPYNIMMIFNNFYPDIKKLFVSLLQINIKPTTIVPLETIFNTRLMRAEMLSEKDVADILHYIDKIEFI